MELVILHNIRRTRLLTQLVDVRYFSLFLFDEVMRARKFEFSSFVVAYPF